MMSVLLVLLVSFAFVTLFGHIVHWSLHQKWMGRFNESHMVHHQKLYPPNDFSSDIYRDAGKDSTTKFFLVVTIPLIIATIAFAIQLHLPWYLLLFALSEMVFLGWLHDYLHDAFHIKNHFLFRTPIIKNFFIVWHDLHYVHHVNMQKNFGIFTFVWDKIFGSFEL